MPAPSFVFYELAERVGKEGTGRNIEGRKCTVKCMDNKWNIY